MRIILGVSGASGMILAYKAMKALTELEHHVELVMTSNASYTATLEMGKEFSSAAKFVSHLAPELQKRVTIHPINDVGATIGSGSYLVDGMLLLPCSMATLAAISIGLGDNLLRRAADVMLKERRPLVIVPRESPLSEIHLENMLSLTRKGAIIVPPVPAWYTHPKTLDDVENFIVGKSLDALKVTHSLYPRWTGS